MQNNRDDKYEEHRPDEESEYHFSEDDVSYEIESEAPKAAPPAVSLKDNLIERLKKSKRILISLSVFFVLIFIVYKIMTPSSPTPPTNIVSEASTSTFKQNAPMTSANTPRTAATQTAAPQQQQPMNAPIQSMQATSTNQATPTAPISMPNMIPVQSPAAINQSGVGVEARMAAMTVNNDKLMAQMQAEYTQKLNDFAAQNSALQNQIQLLNTRVANLEAQITQLVQTLTHQNEPMKTTPMPEAQSPQSQSQSAEVKIPYNVQAIIPGRAWLRSESGETLTVAEGDQIKDIGRVTKIDPYDGIVEINTGNKVISLSYGMGGN